jgi:cell division transport system ATP-binding protein
MIQVLHLSKIYGPNRSALTDITLAIATGELAFVSGPSGAGKSTLLKLLFREEEPSEGQILIDGRNIARLSSRGVAHLRRKIGLIFQEFRLLPHLTALDNVALAAQVIGVSKRESRTKAYQLLRELGLKERYDAKPLTLSGGEQQRVAIARALVNEPSLLLADEPTGNIDDETAGEIMGLLVKIRERGTTILIATHDRQIIQRYGTRLILLDRGVLVDAQENGR